jgi:HD superfamily phosphohydrolase
VIRSIFRRLVQLVHADAPPAGLPRAILRAARAEPVALADYLALDDALLGTAFAAWASSAADPVLRDLCGRLERRALFKTVDLVRRRFDEVDRAHDIARAHVRAAGYDPDLYAGIDRAVDVSYLDPGEPLEEVWVAMRSGPPQKLGDVSEIIGRLRGREREHVRVVVAPEVRDAVRKDLQEAGC